MTNQEPKKLSESELCPPDLLPEQERAYERDVERLLLARHDEFVQVTCPACGSRSANAEFTKYGLNFMRCVNCRTIYVSPRPSETVLADYYQNAESYQFWAAEIFPASEAARREKLHIPWYDRIREYCATHGVNTGTLVEIGAGFGTFCSVAQDTGDFKRIIAVEPTPGLARHCRERGLEVYEKRFEDIDGTSLQADVVVSFEVIEHLFSPRDFILTIRQILKPGGLLVLSCPNGEGFDIATLGPASLAVDAEHINLFNPKSLALLLEASGYKMLEASTPGRLDAEFVRDAAQKHLIDISQTPFLQRVLIDDWEHLGWPFQMFLAENGLSSHMWLAAQKYDSS